MSFISSLFNPSQGAGYQAQSANILNPSTVDQANNLYNRSQFGIDQQANFLGALNGQSGIGTQNALSQMLMAQAQGGGPNPALAQLNQTTGQNVANQAALMAGQRGTSANPGLIARLAAQQGAGIQQNAVGQAAVMRANQQLAAQNALQNLAGQQVGQRANAITGLNQATQSEQQNILNGIAQQNNANVGMQSNMNNANSGIAQTNASGQYGLLSGAGAAAILAAHGGKIPRMDNGGQVPVTTIDPNKAKQVSDSFKGALGFANGGSVGPTSFVGRYMSGFEGGMPGNQAPNQLYDTGIPRGQTQGPNMMSNAAFMKHDMGSGMPTPDYAAGNALMTGQNLMTSGSGLQGVGMAVAHGGRIRDFRSGGRLPGKAQVKGDSYKNDTVPIMGSPGEIMLPRSVTMAKDAPKKAAQFVAAIQAKRGLRKSG